MYKCVIVFNITLGVLKVYFKIVRAKFIRAIILTECLGCRGTKSYIFKKSINSIGR